MSKFTIFSIILAVSVITVTADLVLRDYFAENGQASVLDADVSPVIADTEEESRPVATGTAATTPAEASVTPPAAPETAASANPVEPIATEQPTPIAPPTPTVTQDIVREAGFTGAFSEQFFNGRLYQLLDITKIPVDGIGLYEISQDGVPVASVTEITLRDEIRALQMYVLLQNKTKPYIDLSLNETNAYGDRSFYINHAKKPEEAFLTVKIRNRIYGFAYVKFHHPEIKKLIQLLYG